MSASEIIEEFQKLPPTEQERVWAFMRKMRDQEHPGDTQVRYASDPDFDKSADRILRERAELFRRLAK
jgi:hypothetical protein